MHANDSLKDQYCIFEWRTELFAFPAAAVREVLAEASVSRIPLTPATVAGVCHVRNEFLPVLQLGVSSKSAQRVDQSHLLVVSTGGENWALRVDRVLGLECLEAEACVERQDPHVLAAAMVGSATFDRRVVRILNTANLARLVETELRQELNGGCS